MRVVVEPAGIGERGAQRMLTGMAEGWMAEVVSEAERLRKVLIQPERAGDGAADLRDFDAVGEPDPKVIAVGCYEDLSLVAKPAEGDRMDDPVAVALKNVTGSARAGAGFGIEAAAGV